MLCHYPFPIHAFVMMFHRWLHHLYLNSVLRLLIKHNCVTKKGKKQPARVSVAPPIVPARYPRREELTLEDSSERHCHQAARLPNNPGPAPRYFVVPDIACYGIKD